MNTARKYSIVIVTLNNAEGLSRTLQSVRQLHYASIETIVVNGGSDADTKELLSANHDIITLAISEADTGIYNAMNKGIRHVTGDYTVFMNAGDIFAHNGVLSLVSYYDGDIILGGETYGGVVRMVKPTMSLYDILSIGINHQAVYYRSDLLKKYPFDESYRLIADLKSVIEPLAKESASVSFIRGEKGGNREAALDSCYGGGGECKKKGWRDTLTERQRIIDEVIAPLYKDDYSRFSRINNDLIGDFIVLSHFRSIFPLIRFLARIMRFLNNRFKHIPID